MRVGLAQVFDVVLDRFFFWKWTHWNRTEQIVAVHGVEHFWIVDLHIFSIYAHGLLFLRAADVSALGDRHDEGFELPWLLFQQLAAGRDIAAGRINSCFI